ncbi:MAG TPA: hypothetical protein VFD19_00295 [Clostridia bacterium]|nr:hypothetical protein [Clostridia bacterium]
MVIVVPPSALVLAVLEGVVWVEPVAVVSPVESVAEVSDPVGLVAEGSDPVEVVAVPAVAVVRMVMPTVGAGGGGVGFSKTTELVGSVALLSGSVPVVVSAIVRHGLTTKTGRPSCSSLPSMLLIFPRIKNVNRTIKRMENTIKNK